MNQRGFEFKAGLFTLAGVALFASALLILGGGSSWFKRQQTYFAHFDSVDGLIPGAKVVLSGLQVGTVEDLSIDSQSRDVVAKLTVERKFKEWIRKGTTAEITTMGVLGDKFVRLTQGDPESEPLPPLSAIEVKTGNDLNRVLNRGDQLLVTLNSIAISMERLIKGFERGNRIDQLAEGLTETAKNLQSASGKLNRALDEGHLKDTIRNLNTILEKINNGQGSLGALINDPALYDEAKSLVGGANRNRIVRNLVRQTIEKAQSSDTK